jgi:hypothetical protein
MLLCELSPALGRGNIETHLIRAAIKKNDLAALGFYRLGFEGLADKRLQQFRRIFHYAVQPKDVESLGESEFSFSMHSEKNFDQRHVGMWNA